MVVAVAEDSAAEAVAVAEDSAAEAAAVAVAVSAADMADADNH